METENTINNNVAKPEQCPMSGNDRDATKKSLIILIAIFVSSLVAMFYVYLMFPELEESERQHLKVPIDIEDAKMLAKVLDRYKDMYHFQVMFGVVLLYILHVCTLILLSLPQQLLQALSIFTVNGLRAVFEFDASHKVFYIGLQTFAIPGSLFLSILSGFLYNFPTALMLVCFCSALGATLCYLLSQLVGRRLVRHFFPKRAETWSKQVDKHRDNLFSYMMFLRITPFLPNWFINLVAPVIGVPLYPFVFGTFFGVAPPSIIAIQAGKTLHSMSSSKDAFSFNSVIILSICAILSLLPGIFKNKFKSKLE